MATLRLAAGMALAGTGLLVSLGVTPHESAWAGALALAVGAGLLAWGLPTLQLQRARLVGAVGLAAVLGVTAHEAATHNGLTTPEMALAVYGLLLAAAAPALQVPIGRTNIGTLIGWSLPLVLAPLGLYAVDGLASGDGASNAQPVVATLVVAPTAAALRLLGTPVQVIGSNMLLDTPRGGLTLGVGLVCAGLYPMVLFGGFALLHAWRSSLGAARASALLGTGLGGLWLLNVARLAMLAKVGIAQGGEALQKWHDHLGWILFVAFMASFWTLVAPRIDGRHTAARASKEPGENGEPNGAVPQVPRVPR